MNVVGGFCYWVDGTLGLQKQTVVGVLPTSVDGIRQLGPTVIVGSVDQQLPSLFKVGAVADLIQVVFFNLLVQCLQRTDGIIHV